MQEFAVRVQNETEKKYVSHTGGQLTVIEIFCKINLKN